MMTIKTTYRNIENEAGPMFRPLVLVYAETLNNEGAVNDDADITIEVTDRYHYNYRLSTGTTQYDIIDDGTVTFDDYMNAALVDIVATMADCVKCMVNLDNDYIYYFH